MGRGRSPNSNLSSGREQGIVSVDGVEYSLNRDSAFGDFVLRHRGSGIARVTKPSAFRREFVISDELADTI